MDTPPNPQPMLQPDPRRSKPPKARLPIFLSLAALFIALGGWGMGQFFAGGSDATPAIVADNLTQEALMSREQLFHSFPHFSVATVPEQEVSATIATLPLPPEQKAQLEQTVVHNGGQRLVELVVWDDVAVDGDVVQVDSLGYSQQITLTKTPQTLAFPVEDGVPVVITGIHDGGGGITLGFTGSGQAVSMPVMSVGQTLNLYLR